jgi:hypothetical protein
MVHPYLAQILTELLPQALEDGITVQGPHGDVTLRLHHAGQLIITSGRIVAWDPLWLDETTPALEVPIPPGQYPVVLTIAGGQVPAYATLRVRQSRPVRWEIARFDEGETPDNDVVAEDDEIPGYPVDTGIGCFADVEAARVFARRLAADAEYHMVIAHGMNESDPSGTGWGWGAVSLEPDSDQPACFLPCVPLGDEPLKRLPGFQRRAIAQLIVHDLVHCRLEHRAVRGHAFLSRPRVHHRPSL